MLSMRGMVLAREQLKAVAIGNLWWSLFLFFPYFPFLQKGDSGILYPSFSTIRFSEKESY